MRSDARLLGQTSYIYEAGCGVMIDGERTYLTGRLDPGRERGRRRRSWSTPGVPDLLFEHFGDRLEWHAPWHTGRELSLLMRGRIDVAEANELLARARPRRPALPRQRRDRAADGGDRRARCTPTTWFPAGRARRRGSPSTSAPAATRPRTASRSATRSRTWRRRRPWALLLRRQRPRARRGAARGARRVRQRHRHRGRDGRRLLRGRDLDPGDAMRAPIPGG